MACAGCPGCGSGCTEPTCSGACSAFCSPDASPGYTICPWPGLSGSVCQPDDCATYANQKFCLHNVGSDVWESNSLTVDCTARFGVVADIRWRKEIHSTGRVWLYLNAYNHSGGAFLENLLTYAGRVTSGGCGSTIRVFFVSGAGFCSGSPGCIYIVPLCCPTCPDPPFTCCPDPCVLGATPDDPGPASASLDGSPPDTAYATVLPAVTNGDMVCGWVGIVGFIDGNGNFRETSRTSIINGTCAGVGVGYILRFARPGGEGFTYDYFCLAADFSCDPGATNVFTYCPGNGLFGQPTPSPSSINQTWT
jgi:hypothetical protein